MLKGAKGIYLFLIFLSATTLLAQKKTTNFGLQFKPILSAELINTGPQEEQVGDIGFKLEPKGGYIFGMVVRHNFSKLLSLETGINFTRRNYQLSITDDSSNFKGVSDFRYIIYEIPILGLVYVQLGQQTYLNAAFGLSLNFLPSDWDSFDYYYYHYSQRKSWISPSLLANIGFEYRTYDKGYLYLGFSYNRPFSELTTARVLYKVDDLEKARTFFDVNGNYLTLDLRYFFHEPTNRKNNRR